MRQASRQEAPMTERPLVGVTGPDRGGLVAWLMTAVALRRSGAKPVRITPGRPCDETLLDAVVIGGGSDVDPFHYGEDRLWEKRDRRARQSTVVDWLIGFALSVFRALFATYKPKDYDPDRDALEKRLIKHALYFDLPILGICRGAQLMNVTLGGSLHQDLGHFYTEETSNVRSILPRKIIRISDATRLRDILGTEGCQVNALHDQSIKELGQGIVISAAEPNGIVQAIEKRGHPFFIGVQWHPEYIPQSSIQQGLFRHLVRCARERMGRADRQPEGRAGGR
jgi:putative glutamine amidotransferase